MYRKLAWLGIPHPCQASDEVLQWLLQYETYEEMALAITSCCPWDYGNDMDDVFWIRSLNMGFDAAVGFDRQSVCYDTTERERPSTLSWGQLRRSHIQSTWFTDESMRAFFVTMLISLAAYLGTDSLEFGMLVSCLCTYVLR